MNKIQQRHRTSTAFARQIGVRAEQISLRWRSKVLLLIKRWLWTQIMLISQSTKNICSIQKFYTTQRTGFELFSDEQKTKRRKMICFLKLNFAFFFLLLFHSVCFGFVHGFSKILAHVKSVHTNFEPDIIIQYPFFGPEELAFSPIIIHQLICVGIQLVSFEKENKLTNKKKILNDRSKKKKLHSFIKQ